MGRYCLLPSNSESGCNVGSEYLNESVERRFNAVQLLVLSLPGPFHHVPRLGIP